MTHLIVALDTQDMVQARNWARAVAQHSWGLKFGGEFYFAFGPAGVHFVNADLDLPVMLDLKLHETPDMIGDVVSSILTRCADIGVKPWGLTVHALGGPEMVKKASAVAKEYGVKTLAVTILSTMTAITLSALELPAGRSRQAAALGVAAMNAGAYGLVCGGADIHDVKRACPRMPVIVAGVRPIGSLPNGHAHAITPQEAVERGADYVVVGRPITGGANASRAAQGVAEMLVPRVAVEAKV